MIEIMLISVSLAMDAFAVSISCGISGKDNRKKLALSLSLTFGLFQGIMLYLGYMAGSLFKNFITGVDHFIAFFLLLFIGLKMIKEAFDADKCMVFTSTKMILLLGVATSIDAMAAGISLIATNINITLISLMVSAITFLLSFIGVYIGSHSKGKLDKLSKYVEILGGLILIGIGTKILVEHIWF